MSLTNAMASSLCFCRLLKHHLQSAAIETPFAVSGKAAENHALFSL